MKNRRGESIDGIRRLKRDEYGTGKIDENGQPEVAWEKFLSKNADERGFDKTNKESNGDYKMQTVLPYGTIIIRFGNDMGHYTAPQGTDYEKLAMPYTEESMEYNEYKVIADNIHVSCVVEKGKTAPGFDSDGGATQYYHSMTILQSIRNGLLERL